MRNNFDLCKKVDELSDLYITTGYKDALEEIIRSLAIMVNRNYTVMYIDEESGFYETVDLRYTNFSLPKVIFDYEFTDKDINMLDVNTDNVTISYIHGDATYNTVRIAKGLSEKNLKETLIHELVHVAQYRIPGYEFDETEEYRARTHEEEAFSISEYVCSKQYTEHISNRRLRVDNRRSRRR